MLHSFAPSRSTLRPFLLPILLLLPGGFGSAFSDEAADRVVADGQNPQASIIELGDDPQRVRFTFQNALWPDVLTQFAAWSGLTLDLTDTPPGDFSYFDNRGHSTSEAIDILNGYLLPRGHVLLRRDRFLVCLKTDNEMLSNLIPTVSLEQLELYGENSLVRVIVPLTELDAVTAAAEVVGVLGPFGKATPLESSDSVVLQGFGSGLRQALDILRISRRPVTDDKLDFRSYRVTHLPVADAEKQIRNLFGIAGPATARNVSGARSEIDRERYYRDRSGRGEREGEERSQPPIPLLQKVAMNMQVSSLERTNTLLVTATPEGLALVEELLLSIDVPLDDGSEDFAKSSEPELRVYGMLSADESEVAKTIDVLMPGVIVNEDRRQDTIHVFGNEQQHREVQRLIKILDINEGGSRSVEVIPLQKSNPTAAANFLNQLFANADRNERPSIQAELASRSIIVRGTENQVEEVRQALTKLGEPGLPVASSSRGPSIRRVQIGGGKARPIAETARQILSNLPDGGPQIQIVVPGTASPVDPVTHPKESTDHAKKLPQKAAEVEILQGSMSYPSKSPLIPRLSDPPRFEEVLTATTSEAFEERLQSRPQVQINVDDDGLIVSSGDPDALQSVEDTLRELVRQMPTRKSWTVFYLRVAESTKAAAQLNELIFDPATMLAADGVFLADNSSETLRIVADKRTNSLLVNGTTDQLLAVEGFLEIIDATEIPGSFIDRKPHAIAVQYANVDEIADLLRTLYKDYLVDPAIERARALRSSRSDGDRGDRSDRSSQPTAPAVPQDSPGIRLTLAVDQQTREILVACNDQLYQEIQAVVRERDESARQTQPVVEVLNLSPGIEIELRRALQVFGDRVQTTEVEIPASPPSVNRSDPSRGDDRGRGRNR